MKEFIITILAPPGGGKGTQGKLLRDKLDAHYLASGDLIRKIKEQPSELGKGVKARYDQGIPQPDEVITDVFMERVKSILTKNSGKKFIFDSFPLSVGQAKSLQKLANAQEITNTYLIYLDVSPESIARRISQRKFCHKCGASFLPSSEYYSKGICNKCGSLIEVRDDDKPEIVKRRIREYMTRVKEIKDFYQKQNRLIIVDGEPSIPNVHNTLIKELTKHGVIDD